MLEDGSEKATKARHYGNAFWIHFGVHDFMDPSRKDWREGDEEVSPRTCSQLWVWVVGLNFTLFKRPTIEATRERKATPRPHPLELYKDLNNFEWSMVPSQDTMPPRRIFYNWILYGKANPPFTGGHAVSIGQSSETRTFAPLKDHTPASLKPWKRYWATLPATRFSRKEKSGSALHFPGTDQKFVFRNC